MTDQQITPEQEALIESAYQEALKSAFNTTPADRTTAEHAVAGLYRCLGRTPPPVHWFQGPLSAELAYSIVEHEKLSGKALQAALTTLATMTVGDLRTRLGDRPRKDTAQVAVAGGEELAWIAYYETGAKLGAKYDKADAEALEHWGRLARASGWWYPFHEAVLMCERPLTIKHNDQGVLHSATGPAIETRDGTRLYSWNGTTIPGEWIEDKAKIDPSLALTWRNVEQRRCLAEILGWNVVLERLKPEVIDKDKDPLIGELLECNLPDVGRARFLRAQCGTGRMVVVPVPRECKTALEANAQSYGITPEELRSLEVRT